MSVYLKIIVLLLLPGSWCSAQVIKGEIRSGAGLPLAGCAVVLLRLADSSRLQQGSSGEQGQFSLSPVPPGNYLLQLRQPGYIAYDTVVPVAAGATAGILLTLRLAAAVELKEVAVSMQYPLVTLKDGVLELQVTDNALAAGSTVLELLKQLPGVVIDARQQISVNGKAGVGIMIDGRLQQIPLAQLMSLLGNMSAGNVSAIQLIKNPQAQYDAAGNAGLLHIITRKARTKGISGTVSQSMGLGKRFGMGTSIALNARADRWRVFSDISLVYRRPLAVNELDRYLSVPQAAAMQEKGATHTEHTTMSLRAGAEYDAGRYTTLGITGSIAPAATTDLQRARTDIDYGVAYPYQYLSFLTRNEEQYGNTSVGLYALQKLDTLGTQLSWSADYTRFGYTAAQQNENKFYGANDLELLPMIAYRNDNRLDFRILAQKLDFTRRLAHAVLLKAGVKVSHAVNHSDAGLQQNEPGTAVFYRDTLFSNHFRYEEQIYAAYLTAARSWGPIALQAGLRTEHTRVDAVNRTTGYRLQRRYTNLFPNMSLDYKANEKSSWQLSYSYRLDRPAYYQLNPSRTFSSQLEYGTGNPELKPQYSHNVALDFSHNNRFTLSLGYTHIAGTIYGYPFMRAGTQVQVDTVVNFTNRNLVSCALFVQQQYGGWYHGQLSVTVAYTQFGGDIEGARANSAVVAAFASCNNEFYLPHHYRLQLNGSVISGYKDAIQTYYPRGTLDIALQKAFLDDKLLLSAGLYDLCYTDATRIRSDLPGQQYHYLQRNDTRRCRLTLNWKFGRTRIARKLDTPSDEESKRLRKGA